MKISHNNKIKHKKIYIIDYISLVIFFSSHVFYSSQLSFCFSFHTSIYFNTVNFWKKFCFIHYCSTFYSDNNLNIPRLFFSVISFVDKYNEIREIVIMVPIITRHIKI